MQGIYAVHCALLKEDVDYFYVYMYIRNFETFRKYPKHLEFFETLAFQIAYHCYVSAYVYVCNMDVIRDTLCFT